jgi:hypothetical protein
MRTRWRWAWLALALTGLVGCGAMDEVQDGEERGELEAQEEELGSRDMSRDMARFEYFEDFEGRVGSEWSPARTHVTPVGGRRFLGEFGVEEVTLTLKDRGETRWVLHPWGAGDDHAEAVTHDRDGNIIVAGIFDERLQGGPLTIKGDGHYSLLLAKLRPSGERVWARTFPGGRGHVSAVTTDRERNIVLAGIVLGEAPLDFGGGPLRGAFLVKLDREGRHLWSRQFNSFPTNALATDRLGNILLAGDITDEPVDFGSGPLSTLADSMGVLVKFNPRGGLEWVRGGGANFRFGHLGVTVDSEDQVYTSGSDGEGRPFIEKVSPEGQQLWMRVLDTVGEAFGVAVHGNRVVATGNFSDPFSFRGRDIVPTPLAPESFIVAYTRDGEERWARSIGGRFTSIAMDPRDGVTVTGQYAVGADLGLGPVFGEGLSHDNFFVAKYDRIHGEVRWVRTFPSLNATVRAVSSDKRGESTLVGLFRAPVDFGLGPVTPTAGSADLFILRLGK